LKALVHIGPPKSGTTSIQTFLRSNKQQLSSNHIAILANREWIRSFATMFRDNAPSSNWYLANYHSSKQSFEQFKEHATKLFRNEMKRLPSTTQLVVISSEGLFSSGKEEMYALQRLLAEFCEQTEIITYLRRQDLMAISTHKNRIRNKSRVKPITDGYQRNSDYWRQLQQWAAVFGREQINVRRFPDSAPQKFNLLEQFQSELVARVDSWSGDFEMPENRNIGWNWQATEFLRIANQEMGAQLSDVNFRRRLVHQIDRQFTGGEKSSINRRVAKAIVASYCESNENVRKTFFPDEGELFHDDFSKYPESDVELNQQLSVEMAVQLSISLMAGLVKDSKAHLDHPVQGQLAGPLRACCAKGGRIVNRVRRLCGI